jgi:myo-inositol-1-phosphate synthase
MLIHDFRVDSPCVEYTEDYITSTYKYDSTKLSRTGKGDWIVSPTSTEYQFRVDRHVPKLGYVDWSKLLRGSSLRYVPM